MQDHGWKALGETNLTKYGALPELLWIGRSKHLFWRLGLGLAENQGGEISAIQAYGQMRLVERSPTSYGKPPNQPWTIEFTLVFVEGTCGFRAAWDISNLATEAGLVSSISDHGQVQLLEGIPARYGAFQEQLGMMSSQLFLLKAGVSGVAASAVVASADQAFAAEASAVQAFGARVSRVEASADAASAARAFVALASAVRAFAAGHSQSGQLQGDRRWGMRLHGILD